MKQAKETLSLRYQASGKTSTCSIEDVLRQCRHVDLDMTEPDRIAHRYKCSSHDLFSFNTPKSANTLESLITEYKNYENLHSGRIFYSPFNRLPQVTQHHSSCNYTASLMSNIVRNELGNLMMEIRGTASSSVAALLTTSKAFGRLYRTCFALRVSSHELI